MLIFLSRYNSESRKTRYSAYTREKSSNVILSLVGGSGRTTTLAHNDFELSMVVDDSRDVSMEEAFLSF
jgi:hypothetical protein